MAVNFCSNCGAKLRVGAKFCGSCGQKIQSEEKQLPPMPYEKPKSVMEVYAEKKAVAQVQSESAIKLEKTLPAPQTQSKSVAEVFAEQKKIDQSQAARENLINTYNKTKNTPQETSSSQSENSSPPQDPPPQSIYTPLNEYTSPYKEDVTIKEKFFSIEGRLNRWRYFTRGIWLIVPSMILAFMFLGSSSNGQMQSNESIGLMVVLILYELIAIVPSVMLGIRRLHDLNLSGWFWLIFLVPYVNIIFGLYILFAPGTVGPNKYGADPLENERRFNQ